MRRMTRVAGSNLTLGAQLRPVRNRSASIRGSLSAYGPSRSRDRGARRSGGLGSMDAGDTAWMLTSTALVMIMLPGLALFYGGLVRRKNVLSTIMHSFFGLAIVSVVWILVGFSLAFGPDANGSGLIGNFDYVGFMNVTM